MTGASIRESNPLPEFGSVQSNHSVASRHDLPINDMMPYAATQELVPFSHLQSCRCASIRIHGRRHDIEPPMRHASFRRLLPHAMATLTGHGFVAEVNTMGIGTS